MDGCTCDVVNVVRNICAVRGRNKKKCDDKGVGNSQIYALLYMASIENVERRDYSNSQRLVIRFEDLELYPRENLQRLCDEWDIPM